MRKVILYIATSLDNFIAKKDGDTSWLHDPEITIPNEDYGYYDMLNSVDTVIMGNSSYQEISKGEDAYPYSDKTTFVFSRTKSGEDDNAIFINSNVASFVEELKQEKGKDIWLLGGAQINTVLLEAGLIDKIVLTIIPIFLGNGVHLFAEHDFECKFKLDSSQSYSSGLVQLRLSKR